MITIRAGDLRDVVTLKTTTPSSTGNDEAVVRTQHCKIEPAGAKARELAGAQSNEVMAKFTFRDKPVVQANYIIVDGDGRRFTIDTVNSFPRDKQEVFARINDRINT